MGDSVKKYYEDEENDLYWKSTMTRYPGDIEVTIDKPKKDSYVQLVKAKFEERSQTGIKKYNTTLEREDLNLLDWLSHAQEEAMDFTLYLERIMAEVKALGLDKLDTQ
jgi:hypothetical protein